MQDDLEKLYGILKDGNSAGIDIVPFFEGYERERMKKSLTEQSMKALPIHQL
jgi:hypothetical protein